MSKAETCEGFREAGVWLSGVNVRARRDARAARRGRDRHRVARRGRNRRATLPLSVEDRQRILAGLHDPPFGLEELRGVLLGELVWHEPIAS